METISADRTARDDEFDREAESAEDDASVIAAEVTARIAAEAARRAGS